MYRLLTITKKKDYKCQQKSRNHAILSICSKTKASYCWYCRFLWGYIFVITPMNNNEAWPDIGASTRQQQWHKSSQAYKTWSEWQLLVPSSWKSRTTKNRGDEWTNFSLLLLCASANIFQYRVMSSGNWQCQTHKLYL